MCFPLLRLKKATSYNKDKQSWQLYVRHRDLVLQPPNFWTPVKKKSFNFLGVLLRVFKRRRAVWGISGEKTNKHKKRQRVKPLKCQKRNCGQKQLSLTVCKIFERIDQGGDFLCLISIFTGPYKSVIMQMSWSAQTMPVKYCDCRDSVFCTLASCSLFLSPRHVFCLTGFYFI